MSVCQYSSFLIEGDQIFNGCHLVFPRVFLTAKLASPTEVLEISTSTMGWLLGFPKFAHNLHASVPRGALEVWAFS